MSRIFIKTATGTQVSDTEALDERGHLRDGITMRTSHMMMDGNTLQPPQTKNYDHVEEYRRRISDAWRTPDAPFAPTKAPVADTQTAYQRYDHQIANAWR